MRQVQVADVEGHVAELVAEAERGERVTLMRDGRAVAEIVPFAGAEKATTQEERDASWERVREIQRQGFHMGGLRIESRDDLWTERDDQLR